MANVPSTAKEVKFIAYFESGTPIIFESEFLYSTFTTSNRSFQLGGYYATNNNYVACYVTATKTTSVLSGLGAIAGLQKALIIYYR